MNGNVLYNVSVSNDRYFVEGEIAYIQVDRKLAKEIMEISSRVFAAGSPELVRKYSGNLVRFFVPEYRKMEEVRLHVSSESFWFSASDDGIEYVAQPIEINSISWRFGLDFSLAA